MRNILVMIISSLIIVISSSVAIAQRQFPSKMLNHIECLKRHGLLQGTVTDVRNGDAHFAPYFRVGRIGAKIPAMKYNKDFVEGRLIKSPEIIKVCNPNTTLHKVR